MRIPPELMTPEQRGDRALQVEREISREWLRFAITEFVFILLPFAVILAVLVLTDRAESALVPIVITGGALCGVLVTYWLTRRIQPLQKELEALRAEPR